MKKKHLFSAVALAAVFAGCSQDELISESNKQSIGDRPMVEAPTITLGANTRMTTSNNFAGVTWQAGDGFGACVMDEYDKSKTDWAQFVIKDYISSNVLYQTTDGKTFTADASLCQGNYLFYAPFNEANYKRGPLEVQLPTEQIVVPNADGTPSNTAIKNFYEAKKYPVFIAYDSIWKSPKTELSLHMKHIYSLPHITLKLGQVQLLDAQGVLKVDANGQPVYETSITVDSIKFTNSTSSIVTAGTIKNSDVIANIAKDAKGNVAWDVNQYETAKTADIVAPVTTNKPVWVKFNPAITITTGQNGKFLMVLPGASYAQADLAVEVYTTINNEAYVLANNSTAAAAKTITPARDLILLPGLPYSADEYNKDGSMKDTKGTSATYTVDGGFIPAKSAIASGYTQIKNYDELTSYVQKVAYRGEALIEITKAMAEAYMANNNGQAPDPRKYFVITTTDKAPIALDDAFLKEFDNACVIEGKNASISFRPNSKLVTLGDITFDDKDTPVMFDAGELTYGTPNDTYNKANLTAANATYVSGNTILTGNGTALAKFGNLTVNKGATLTIDKDFATVGATVINDGGAITSASTAKELTLTNTKGEATLNASPVVNTDTKSTITNGGTLTINTNIAEANVELTNNADAKAIVNRATVVFATNDGLVEVKHSAANVTVKTGSDGEVDNTIGGKITNTATQTVFATFGAMTNATELAKYDALTALTDLNLTGEWTITENEAIENILKSGAALATIKNINFNAGSSMTLGVLTLNLTSSDNLEKININADVEWSGRSEGNSIVKIGTGIGIVEASKPSGGNYTLTKRDMSVDEND